MSLLVTSSVPAGCIMALEKEKAMGSVWGFPGSRLSRLAPSGNRLEIVSALGPHDDRPRGAAIGRSCGLGMVLSCPAFLGMASSASSLTGTQNQGGRQEWIADQGRMRTSRPRRPPHRIPVGCQTLVPGQISGAATTSMLLVRTLLIAAYSPTSSQTAWIWYCDRDTNRAPSGFEVSGRPVSRSRVFPAWVLRLCRGVDCGENFTVGRFCFTRRNGDRRATRAEASCSRGAWFLGFTCVLAFLGTC